VIDRSVGLDLQASISPTAGILVKDLWSAHTTRRAWAVRGANLACKNGEVVLLLGDAGSGKSRLLTVLAESAAATPRMAVTSTRVRGSIAFGGVEVTKWEKSQLIKRLGLSLSDVRTIADISRVLSGLSIEEILEPSSGTRSFADVSHNPASTERNAMLIALKITGLYSTLLPRLPSRLSTVVTANEEDLRPSSLKPRSSLLSSQEWSKLLLARVLTQAIADNENSASSHEKVEQCLIGSFLILDDATAYFSEVDEARVMQDLRRTGAATLMASNRWATGRLADRIVVLRDGAIVESGTHNELLNRGPQQSIYAAKWHAMTSM
jgi:ABC-type multidrug transport system fused ATPase/permease subunit